MSLARKYYYFPASSLTCKHFLIHVRIECSCSGEHDGGVEVPEDAGHGVGRVLQGVGPAGQGVEGGEDTGALLPDIAGVVRDVSQDEAVVLSHPGAGAGGLDQLDGDLAELLDGGLDPGRYLGVLGVVDGAPRVGGQGLVVGGDMVSQTSQLAWSLRQGCVSCSDPSLPGVGCG